MGVREERAGEGQRAGLQRGESLAENARGWGFRRVTGLKVAGEGISWREELAHGQDNLPD